MRPPETDVNRVRWLCGNALTRWAWRVTGLIWFFYLNEDGRRRLFVGRR